MNILFNIRAAVFGLIAILVFVIYVVIKSARYRRDKRALRIRGEQLARFNMIAFKGVQKDWWKL